MVEPAEHRGPPTPRRTNPLRMATLFVGLAACSAVGAVTLLGSDAAVAFYYYREADAAGRQALLSTWLIFQFALSTVVGGLLFFLADPITRILLSSSAHNDLYIQLTAVVFPLSSTLAYSLEILRLQMRLLH